MSVDNQAVFDSLIGKFESDVIAVIHHETQTGRLTESGTARLNIRASIESITRSGEIQLNELFLLKLTLEMAYGLKSLEEYCLASELFNIILNRYAVRQYTENDLAMLIGKVEAIVGEVECDYALAAVSQQARSAPMSVSRLLRCIQRLRGGLDDIVLLTSKQQEDLAWLILNCCKCIIEIAQPLVWTSCGKYIVASIMFAISCIEGVINLCTWRHWNLRMKLYSTAYYGALIQLGTKQAQNILIQAKKQFGEFKEREHLDEPIPERVEIVLIQCEIDIAVMARVLAFWKDPDSFSVDVSGANESLGDQPPIDAHAVSAGAKAAVAVRSFADRCLCECARIQQLTSGNPNEMWKKRASGIMKIFWEEFSQIELAEYDALTKPSDKLEPISEHEGANSVDIKQKPLLSLECLSSMAVLCMFGIVEGAPILDILSKIWLILHKFDDEENGRVANVDVDKDCLCDLRLLKHLADVIDACRPHDASIDNAVTISTSIVSASMLQSLTSSVCELMYSAEGTRRKSLLHRVCVSIWTKFVYSRLQVALSTTDTNAANEALQSLSMPLLHTFQALDISFIEDPVFLASLAALGATLLHHTGDLRGSISLLKRSLEAVDNHRALRVEISMHLPEDARDVAACQRSSFTSGRDYIDWFHGVKRLGAHAFAGFGIFGAGSSADPSDLALADIHADLAALYFRYELEYGIQVYQIRRAYNSAMEAAEHKKEEAAASIGVNTKKHSKTTKKTLPVTTGTTSGEGLMTQIPGGGVAINADKLSCVQSLRSFCCKNVYLKCILLLEMARVDTDESRRQELLSDAKNCIIEAETRESALIESFNDLTLIVDGGPAHAPIILARSHRQIFVVPVALRKHYTHRPPVHYFRVLAKEQGSGTDITLNSDYIGGTETKILANQLISPSSGAVCIQPLRPGERYVFGSAGFAANNDMVGALSPTSIAVDAVNPLPTILLWGFLNRTAFSLNVYSIAKFAALQVCNRYFDQSPSIPLKSLAKGVNININEEPLLCMLAVERSSPFSLETFISCFLSLEETLKTPPVSTTTPALNNRDGSSNIHWEMRRDTQMHLINSIRKTAAVATLASSLRSHEWIVRTVCLGYNLLAELLNYDEMHLANYLLYPTLIFIVSLQFIPKRNWHSLEHQLHCRLLVHAMKLSSYAKNTSPVAILLSKIYVEVADEAEAKLPTDVESDYSCLLQMINVANRVLVNGSATSSVETDLLELLTHASKRSKDTMLSSDYLWQRVPLGKRPAFAYGVGASFASLDGAFVPSPAQSLQRMLKERPEAMSELLVIINCLCNELGQQGQQDKIIPVLNRVTIFDKLLAPSVQRLIEPMKLRFIIVMPSPDEQAAQAIAVAEAEAAANGGKGGKKGAPPAKGALAPVVNEAPTITAEQFAIPTRFVEATSEEIVKQMRGLADIAASLALYCYKDLKERNYFPASRDGPLLFLDPTQTESLGMADACYEKVQAYDSNPEHPISPRTHAHNEANAVATANAAANAGGAKGKGKDDANAAPPAPLQVPLDLMATKTEFIKHISIAISLYTRAQCPAAGIHAAVSLWNMISESWCNPIEFANDTIPIRIYIQQALFSLTQQLEVLIGVCPALNDNNGLESATSITQPVTQCPTSNRTLKEFLLVTKDLFAFLVKVLWLYKQYKDVVDVASRTLEVFITVAPEYSKALGLQFFPLMIHSQEQIIRAAETLLATRKETIVQFVNEFEEAMRKKRRKKLRIARIEKDEDEIKFEAERDVLQGYVDEADSDLKFNENRLVGIENQQKIFQSQYPTGIQLLDRVRVVARAIISDATNELIDDDKNDLRCVIMRSREISARVDDVVEQFTNVGHFLREKKDRLTLIETLKEQASLLLLFGKFSQAKLILIDIVDGFFNVMDAIPNWQSVMVSAHQSFDGNLMPGVIPVIIALGKLSRFCFARDWDWKASCCRMASEIALLPFKESYGHPQTLVGMAAYDCRDLGGVASFAFNSDKLSYAGLSVAWNEIIAVLHEEELYLEQLPLIVLLEHFHGSYTRLPDAWLSARLKRIRALANCGMFSEAGAMIAGIIPTITAIQTRTFHRPLQSPNEITINANYDTCSNGFDYYNLSPFFNHLPPNHELNIKAMAWIESFPSKFASFAGNLKIKLPVPVLTPEEEAARKAAQEEAAAAAAAAAAKDKKMSKKAPGGPSEPAAAGDVAGSEEPTAPMFNAKLQAEVALICALFHLNLSRLDYKTTMSHSAALSKIGNSGISLLDQVLVVLGSVLAPGSSSGDSSSPTVDTIRGDNHWMALYCQSKILRVRHQIGCRQFKEARALLFSLLQILMGFLPSKNTNVFYPDNAVIKPVDLVITEMAPVSLSAEMQFVVAQTWNCAKSLLVDIAERQSRLPDVITITTQNARDASTMMSSYWIRSALVARATAHFKKGNLAECEFDCNAALQSFESTGTQSASHVKCLCLKAALLREQAFSSSAQRAADHMQAALSLLRKARVQAEGIARRAGFAGADANITFSRAKSAELEFDRLPSLLFNLSEIHCNEPELSLTPAINKKMFKEILPPSVKPLNLPSVIARNATNLVSCLSDNPDDDPDYSLIKVWDGRLGPVDNAETKYIESEFGSVYLPSVRSLSGAHAALAMFLMEAIASNATVDKSAAVASGTATAGGKRPMTARLQAALEQRAAVYQRFDKTRLTEELISISEDGLKLQRHIVFASAHVRSALLLAAGSTRKVSTAMRGSDPFIAKQNDPDMDISEYIISPLRTNVELGVFGSVHPWQSMRTSCIELVDMFGDSSIPMPLAPDTRLKLATMYLITAIKLSVQDVVIKENVLSLCSAFPALGAAASKELSDLLSSFSSFSLPVGGSEEPVAAAAGGKGAKGGKAAPTTSTVTGSGLSGRDAMYLLANLQRECNPLWKDSFEYDVWCDIHNLAKKEYEPYKSKCVLSGVPDPSAQLTISISSLSALFMPCKAPLHFVDPADPPVECGLLSHMLVYFLLGPKQVQVAPNAAPIPVDPKAKGKPGAAPTTTTAVEAIGDPILTKAVLFRPHLAMLERKLRKIREKLKEANAKDWPDKVKSCGEQLGEVLLQLASLLKNGYIMPEQQQDPGANQPSGSGSGVGMVARNESGVTVAGMDVSLRLPSSSEPVASRGYEILLPSESRPYPIVKFTQFESGSCLIPVVDECIAKLADVATTVRDVDSIIDNDICTFYRTALGYTDN